MAVVIVTFEGILVEQWLPHDAQYGLATGLYNMTHLKRYNGIAKMLSHEAEAVGNSNINKLGGRVLQHHGTGNLYQRTKSLARLASSDRSLQYHGALQWYSRFPGYLLRLTHANH